VEFVPIKAIKFYLLSLLLSAITEKATDKGERSNILKNANQYPSFVAYPPFTYNSNQLCKTPLAMKE